MSPKCPNCGRPIRPDVVLCDCGHSLIAELEAQQELPEADKQPTTQNVGASRNLVSLVISGITIVSAGASEASAAGAGMEALGSLFHEIILGGLGLLVAFLFACSAMARGEQPLVLTLLAFSIPPLAILFVILRQTLT